MQDKIHPTEIALLDMVLSGEGCVPDDSPSVSQILPDLFRGSPAILNRHIAIHDYHFEFSATELVLIVHDFQDFMDRFLSIACLDHFVVLLR